MIHDIDLTNHWSNAAVANWISLVVVTSLAVVELSQASLPGV